METTKLSQSKSDHIIDKLICRAVKALLAGDKINLNGFGVFTPKIQSDGQINVVFKFTPKESE